MSSVRWAYLFEPYLHRLEWKWQFILICITNAADMNQPHQFEIGIFNIFNSHRIWWIVRFIFETLLKRNSNALVLKITWGDLSNFVNFQEFIDCNSLAASTRLDILWLSNQWFDISISLFSLFKLWLSASQNKISILFHFCFRLAVVFKQIQNWWNSILYVVILILC